MPIILSQKLHQPSYDDIVGEQYHYPKRYWSYINAGEHFIYYHPSESKDRAQYYFGMGRIGTIYQDPAAGDHRYAEIIDYIEFSSPVAFKHNTVYLEQRPEAGNQFFRAVRKISDNVFSLISQAGLNARTYSDIKIVDDIDDVAIILSRFNEQFKDLKPEAYHKLIAQIDRPTSISRALKKKLGHICQVCGVHGFRQKSGALYAEAHHLVELHKLIPGSLATQNVIILCASCHRKLHYAEINVSSLSPVSIQIVINGLPVVVQLNI